MWSWLQLLVESIQNNNSTGCNGCHGLMQNAISFNDVALVYVKGNAYRIHIWSMNKDDAIGIMNNCNLIDKMGIL